MTDHSVNNLASEPELPDWLEQIAGDTPQAQADTVERRFSTFSIVSFLVIAGLLLFIGYALYLRGKSQPTSGPAPTFSITMYDADQLAMNGEKVALKDLQGKAVVINFWASFCIPCQDEAPMLERVWNDYRDQGVVFLGINTEDPATDALDYLAQYQITYPNAPDEGGKIEKKYRITGIPETFVIDTQGNIVQHFMSQPSERELRAQIDRALEG